MPYVISHAWDSPLFRVSLFVLVYFCLPLTLIISVTINVVCFCLFLPALHITISVTIDVSGLS